MKKLASILVICAISMFAVSCSKSSTAPADTGSNESQNGGAESGSTEGY